MTKYIKKLLPKSLKSYLKQALMGDMVNLRTATSERSVGSKGPMVTMFNIIKTIPGAFTFDDAGHFHLVLRFQNEFGIKGDMLEIGSFHGRSTAVMASYLGNGEKLHVCDAFKTETMYESDYYTQNQPTPQQLVSNVRKLVGDLSSEDLIVHNCLSRDLKLPPDKMFRYIHVDGGHSLEEARLDLVLADRHLLDHGIVVVDDYQNPQWPEVTPAVDEFLAEHPNYKIIGDMNRHGAKGRKIYLLKKKPDSITG